MPSFSIAHSIPWSSKEGVELTVKKNKIYITIPKRMRKRFDKQVSLYEVVDDNFKKTKSEKTGHTFHAKKPVEVIKEKRYKSFFTAMKANKGIVKIEK